MVLESSQIIWPSRSSKILAVCYWYFQSSIARIFSIGRHEWRPEIPNSSGRSLNWSATICPHMVTNYYTLYIEHFLLLIFFFSFSFNQLDLPAYETYDKLRTYLLKAIHECSEGFGFAWGEITIRVTVCKKNWLKENDIQEFCLFFSFIFSSSKNPIYISVHILRIYFPLKLGCTRLIFLS